MCPSRNANSFDDQLDSMFGTGTRPIKKEQHVIVTRYAEGNHCYFRKQFLRYEGADLNRWTFRESQILLAVNADGLNVSHVQRYKSITGGPSQNQLETWDAGPDMDQWQQLPVKRKGRRLPHVFLDAAHFIKTAHSILVILDPLHELGFVHCDLKADNICVPAISKGREYDGYPIWVRPQWEEIKLIDFAFSLFEPYLPLNTPLPLGESEFGYQSRQLVEALEAGSSPTPNLELTKRLDWRVDLFSLGFMLQQIHAEVVKADSQETRYWGWTPERHDQVQQLITELKHWDHERSTPSPSQRPHQGLIARLDELLRAEDLACSLADGWEIHRDAHWRPQRPEVRTPPTIPALRVRPREPSLKEKTGVKARWFLGTILITMSIALYMYYEVGNHISRDTQGIKDPKESPQKNTLPNGISDRKIEDDLIKFLKKISSRHHR